MQILCPPSLRDGGTVGIVAPSKWPDPAWVQAARDFFEKNGYRVLVHPHTNLRQNRFAGDDRTRAAALMEYFTNPEIDLVFAARGGCGALRILDFLDYDLIRKNPKPYVGFSDSTVVIHALLARAGLASYHGPMGWNFSWPDCDPRVGPDLLQALRQESVTRLFDGCKVVQSGEAEGRLTGGNLRLLQTLIGTPYDFATDDCILFIEDVAEEFYALDRTLTHLRLAGKFDRVRAVLVGEMVDVRDDPNDPFGGDVEQIVRDHVPAHIPLAFNVPCGHGKYLSTFPVGAKAHVAMGAEGVRLTFSF